MTQLRLVDERRDDPRFDRNLRCCAQGCSRCIRKPRAIEAAGPSDCRVPRELDLLAGAARAGAFAAPTPAAGLRDRKRLLQWLTSSAEDVRRRGRLLWRKAPLVAKSDNTVLSKRAAARESALTSALTSLTSRLVKRVTGQPPTSHGGAAA